MPRDTARGQIAGEALSIRGFVRARKRWRRHLVAPVVVLLALFGIGAALLPRGLDAGGLLYAQDDPALLADRVVADKLNRQVAEQEIATALDAGDTELAQSFAALARENGIVLAPALGERLDGAVREAATMSHHAGVFARGFVTGEPDDMVGLAGTALGDLFVFGDVRDALREGVRFARGETTDEVVLGLACVGLAVTAATYASLGAGTPERVGLSLIKAARKTGRLGSRMGRFIGRSLAEAIDLVSLRRAFASASFAEPAVAVRAARETVKLDRLGRLADLGRDIGRVQRSAGARAAMEGMRIAEGPRDMKRLARLAESKGLKTRAILKLAGRAAIVLTAAAIDLFGWVLFVAMALWSFVAMVKSTTERTTRRVLDWRKRRRGRFLEVARVERSVTREG